MQVQVGHQGALVKETDPERPESIDRQLNRMFNEIDDLLRHGKYDAVIERMDNFDIEKSNEYLMVGMLTITLPRPGDPHIESRSRLRKRISDHLEGKGEDAREILHGL